MSSSEPNYRSWGKRRSYEIDEEENYLDTSYEQPEEEQHTHDFGVNNDHACSCGVPPPGSINGWYGSEVMQQDPFPVPHLSGEAVVPWDELEDFVYGELDWHEAVVTWDAPPNPNVSPFYTHVQDTPSTVWEVKHSKRSSRFIYNIYSDHAGVILPDNVAIIDLNRIAILFLYPIAGKVTFSFDLTQSC